MNRFLTCLCLQVCVNEGLWGHSIHELATNLLALSTMLPSDIRPELPSSICLLGNLIEVAESAFSRPDCTIQLVGPATPLLVHHLAHALAHLPLHTLWCVLDMPLFDSTISYLTPGRRWIWYSTVVASATNLSVLRRVLVANVPLQLSVDFFCRQQILQWFADPIWRTFLLLCLNLQSP